MKIVHITTSTHGGAGIATYRLHESLMQNISEVDSCIVQRSPVSQVDVSKHVDVCTHFHPLSYRIQKRLGVLSYFSEQEYYNKLIGKQSGNYDIVNLPFSYFPIHNHPRVKEADILHLHWTCDFLDYASFFQSVKQPIVWTLHDMYPFMGIYHFQGDKDRNKRTRLDKIDDELSKYKNDFIRAKKDIYIACPSQWMYEKSICSEAFRDYPHQVIANGFDITSYKKIDKAFAKATLNLDNNKKTIFFGADHITQYRKGIDLLISALKQIPEDSYNLISVGNGQICSNTSVGDNSYKHLGFVQSTELLNLIYSAADVTIIPSREDNLPSMMIESMLNGTPVISFSNGGMDEHIKTGYNGILVTEITPESLADSINDYIQDKYTFDSEQIRQYAIDNFNYQKSANSYFNLYKSMLSKS